MSNISEKRKEKIEENSRKKEVSKIVNQGMQKKKKNSYFH
jgi:hypothetical protein